MAKSHCEKEGLFIFVKLWKHACIHCSFNVFSSDFFDT